MVKDKREWVGPRPGARVTIRPPLLFHYADAVDRLKPGHDAASSTNFWAALRLFRPKTLLPRQRPGLTRSPYAPATRNRQQGREQKTVSSEETKPSWPRISRSDY